MGVTFQGKKITRTLCGLLNNSEESAEEEGFEPPDLLQSIVFKTTAIDHSATPPLQTYDGF